MPVDDVDETELRETLKALSADVLRGEPVPDDLAALWRAQFADEVDLLDAYEMVLLEGEDRDIDLLEDLFDRLTRALVSG